MNRGRAPGVEGAVRVAAAAFSAWVVAARVVVAAHEAAVAHSPCEHGAVVHATSDGGAAANAVLPGARIEHRHDCPYLHSQAPAETDTVAAAGLAAAHADAPVHDAPGAPPIAPLSFAPSRSPPA